MRGVDSGPVTKPSDAAREREDVAALVKRRLKAKGMTQRDLADETGIPYSTLNAWITRRRGGGGGINPDQLRLLAEHLDVTAKAMFEANGRQVPGELSQEREAKLLRLFRNLTTEGQRALIQTAEALTRGTRAS
jgi:transcriptional regulator with XRE-family HTH domain